MRTTRVHAVQWATEQLGGVDLGHVRRTRRLVQMASRVAEHPAGRVSEAIPSPKEQQGAYDWLENKQVEASRFIVEVARATAARCPLRRSTPVVVDGSSLSIIDGTGTKGLGSVGTASKPTKGLKVISALALDDRGIPLGALAQTWWARPARKRRRDAAKREQVHKTPLEAKETRHWLTTIDQAAERLDERGLRGCFVIDREGDAHPILTTLVDSGHDFIVRAHVDRIALDGAQVTRLRPLLGRAPIVGSYDLDVPARPKRTGRQAKMVMRSARVVLSLRNAATRRKIGVLPLQVVWVSEAGTTPVGEAPLDWLLFTNLPVDTYEQGREVVQGYAMRWRIEEVHRTWKAGGCDVESTQLRTAEAIIKWATLLFAVAIRVERLKHAARTEPRRAADTELTASEIQALVLLKRREKKRTESIPDAPLDIATAVRWMADLGGYTGNSSGGPPGVTVIRRGFVRVRNAADALEQLGARR